MRIEIKNRINGKILFAHNQKNNSIKATLEAAIRAGVDLSYADLRHANLSYIDLSYVNLSYADLSYAVLIFANLSHADLSYAILTSANLISINLISADLSYAKLNFANLSSANLSFANMSFAELDSAKMQGAKLSSADLKFTDLETATYGEGVIIGNNPLFILGLTWPIYIFKTHIKIGCQIHTKQEWLNFSDADIAKMESRASEFWAKWKKHILWMAFEGNKPKAGSVG
jgi:uncharacterized protein YjbI with pentapeptide repeats